MILVQHSLILFYTYAVPRSFILSGLRSLYGKCLTGTAQISDKGCYSLKFAIHKRMFATMHL